MPSAFFSISTTPQKVVDPNPNRKEVHIINQDSDDQTLRAETNKEDLANSALIAYNRETIVFRGPIAQLAIWCKADASCTVNVSEVF